MGSYTALACPELSQSSHPISVSYAGSPKRNSLGTLNLFECRPLPKRGGIAFLGGHVSVLNWHPTAKGILATAAHNSKQLVHEVLRTYTGSAHIQIWHVADCHASCIGVVPHNGDCTWDLKWRPERSSNTSNISWGGMFAAALGNGCVLICQFKDVDQASQNYKSSQGHTQALPHSRKILRNHKKDDIRTPVRILEWSLDGNRLLVGSVNGYVEVYETSSDENVWPRWVIIAHESILADMRWLSSTLFCTLGISCVLRLRDIRDPVGIIEQNAEGLSGSHSMSMLEPSVAVVGGDLGYLRVIRLCGTDGFKAKTPVRRVYLQGSSFRAMRCANVTSPGDSQSLLYAGGCEGIVHKVLFPRPLWPRQDQCDISDITLDKLLQWRVEQTPTAAEGNVEELHLILGSAVTEISSEQKSNTSLGNVKEAKLDNGKKSITRRTKKLVGPHGADESGFGSTHHQAIVITRVDLNTQDGLIAVGIDGGILTLLPLETKQLGSPLERVEAREMPAKNITRKGKQKNSSKRSASKNKNVSKSRDVNTTTI